MPIHDVGYRTWKGKLTSAWTRWWTISEIGIRTAFSSRWIRRMVLASWFPVIYFGVVLFWFEQTLEQPLQMGLRNVEGPDFQQFQQDVAEAANIDLEDLADENVRADILEEAEFRAKTHVIANEETLQFLPNGDALVHELKKAEDDSDFRNLIWNYIISSFLRYSQGMMTLMIVGLIVPPLISRDVRSRAFLLYYSRPITRLEYLLGKIVVPGFVLCVITMVPAIGLYCFGVSMSPNLSVILDTWDTPFRIVLASCVSIVPVCLLALMLSSLTQESRFAGFAWFSIWGLGAVVWYSVYISNSQGNTVPFDSNWSLISLYSTIGRVQSWIFGIESDMMRVIPSLGMLAMLSLFSFVMLYRRVSAPIRI